MDKLNCNITKDLLPLYIDGVCSEESKTAVENHLSECEHCRDIFNKIKDDETLTVLQSEKEDVISNQKKYFKKKTSSAGMITAGILFIPILICLIVNLAVGKGLDWFFIVLSSILVLSSVTVVPMLMPKHKGVTTLCSITVTLILLLGVCCLYTEGNWFFVSASSSLFGLSVIFLPFVAKYRPIKEKLKGFGAFAVLLADTVLYILMMFCIYRYTDSPAFLPIAFSVSSPVIVFIWLFALCAKLPFKSKLINGGICTALSGIFVFFFESTVNLLLSGTAEAPRLSPLLWNADTTEGNIYWCILVISITVGIILTVTGFIKRSAYNEKKYN